MTNTTKLNGNTLGLQSPWVTTWNKIKALLERDTDLIITTINEEQTDAKSVYSFDIVSSNAAKIYALKKIIKNSFEFGNITLNINFLVTNTESNKITAEDFKNAFNGNNVLKDVETIDTPLGTSNYVVFAREVIQFYNDNIADLYGNFNGLAQDIAKDIFVDSDHTFYCTDVVPAN